MTQTLATLVGVWAVGAEVGFAIGTGGGIVLAVVIVLKEVDGGALASSAAQLLLVEPIHDSVDSVVSDSTIDSIKLMS